MYNIGIRNKTFIDVMLEKFPNVNIDNLLVDCCPENFGYSTFETIFCSKHGCFADCSKCWNGIIVDKNDIEDTSIVFNFRNGSKLTMK